MHREAVGARVGDGTRTKLSSARSVASSSGLGPEPGTDPVSFQLFCLLHPLHRSGSRLLPGIGTNIQCFFSLNVVFKAILLPLLQHLKGSAVEIMTFNDLHLPHICLLIFQI